MILDLLFTIFSIWITVVILKFVLSLAWVAGKLWIKICAYSIEFMVVIGLLSLIF